MFFLPFSKQATKQLSRSKSKLSTAINAKPKTKMSTAVIDASKTNETKATTVTKDGTTRGATTDGTTTTNETTARTTTGSIKSKVSVKTNRMDSERTQSVKSKKSEVKTAGMVAEQSAKGVFWG